MASFPVFHGRVSPEVKLELHESERLLRRTYLRALVGQDVEVIVRKQRVQRSLDQNAYLHAHPFPLLAEHFGYSVPEVKFVLMGECWGWKKVNGKDIPVKPSTSDMTVEECTYFIDWLIPWAAVNHGVAIPLPNEASS